MHILTESFLPKAITMFGIVLGLCIIHSTSPHQEGGNSFFAYAHFFGENITRDGYQVVFQPFPFAPMAGDNTTLNFSILDEENLNIHNIFSALIIQDKKTNETIAIPYRQYMYSDITFPYKFSNNSEYLINLETRIIGDSKFQTQPLTASFDLIVGDQTSEYFKMIMIYFVTPVCAAIIGAILIYELQWKRKKARIKKGKRSTTG